MEACWCRCRAAGRAKALQLVQQLQECDPPPCRSPRNAAATKEAVSGHRSGGPKLLLLPPFTFSSALLCSLQLLGKLPSKPLEREAPAEPRRGQEADRTSKLTSWTWGYLLYDPPRGAKDTRATNAGRFVLTGGHYPACTRSPVKLNGAVYRLYTA